MRHALRWTIFIVYLSTVLAGLAYFVVIGLLRL
jgi:hypothetical protein